jgi:hypothetical protein
MNTSIAQAMVHCGVASVEVGGVFSKQGYCYDDGVPEFPGPPGTPGGGGTPPGGGGSGGPGSYPTIELQKHEMNCAEAYGAFMPADGVITNFSSEWGWVIDKLNLKMETPTGAAPVPVSGLVWDMLDGDTMHIGEPSEETILYMPAYSTRGNAINTLAHEFAHQRNVLDEAAAEKIGQDAEDAYRADKGAKCGGM